MSSKCFSWKNAAAIGFVFLVLVARSVEKVDDPAAAAGRSSTTNLNQNLRSPKMSRKASIPSRAPLLPVKAATPVSVQARMGSRDTAGAAQDQQLQHVVQRVLADDPRTRSLAAQARVENDIAILAGEATTEMTRETAEQYVSRVPGLKRVDDRIVLRPNLDMEIAQRIHEAFSQDPTVDDAAVGVTVVGGKVFLCGELSSPEAVSRACEIAVAIPGVKAVSNGLQASSAARQPATPAWRAAPYGKRSYTIPTYRTPYR
jgi:osmotically-inducible protein OsmY